MHIYNNTSPTKIKIAQVCIILAVALTVKAEEKYLPDPDEVVFHANGATFSAILTVDEGAVIQWIFDDNTTSDSATPYKDYGSEASRINRLKVTPWSALTEINIGYDAGDGGPNTITFLDQQNVTAVTGMANIAPYLQVWASNHNPLLSLDFSDFVNLTEIECFLCQSMESVNLHNTPLLSRACFEDNNLAALDLSESPSLTDLRGAVNAYTSITWGTTGAQVWHICVRDNPQMTGNLPDMSQFPLLSELFVWNDNQSGELHPTSTHLTSVQAFGNHYTSADFTGTFPGGGGGQINLDDNDLTSLTLTDCPGLSSLSARNNALDRAMIDQILATLDGFNTTNGAVDLTGNAPPTSAGMVSMGNLIERGWTVNVDLDTDMPPVIASLGVYASSTTASVIWRTNVPASSSVDYGVTKSYGSNASDSALGLTHFVPITGLTPGTTYHFQVSSIDAGDNLVMSADYTFTTQAGNVIYWEDNFHHADGALGNGWAASNAAAGEIAGNVLRRTDSGQYRILYNPTSGVLPVNYFVTMTVPHSTLTRDWWGLIGRYVPGDSGAIGTGNKVFWMNGGVLQAGVGHADFGNDLSLTTTGGYPESWSTNRVHTVTLGYAGNTVTVYLDGQEMGYFTDDTNVLQGTGIGLVGDGGGDVKYDVYDLMVSNFLPVYEMLPTGDRHSTDTDANWRISATEISRVVTFYNAGQYHLDPATLDGFAPGEGDQSGDPHRSDFNPQDWHISATELSRLVTFYNAQGYHPDPATADGFAPAAPDAAGK